MLSLCSSTLAAAWISKLKFDGKLDMEIILNATLAGGVAVGTAADLIVNPGVSVGVGFFTGVISSLGYIHLTPYLASKFNLHDTCGIHNLHGMPGIIGAIVGIFSFSNLSNDFGLT